MTISGVLDHTFDGDVDVRFVAQMSAIGTLADDILGDLIRWEIKGRPLSQSSPMREATRIFQMAVDASTRPASVWHGVGLSEALRRMTAVSTAEPLTSISNDEQPREQFQRILDALTVSLHDEATPSDVALLRREFSMLSRSTMEATLNAMHNHSYSTSWLKL